jgi:hypothetical protein
MGYKVSINKHSHVSLLDRANRPHKTLKHEIQDIDIPKPRHKQLDPTSVRHHSSSNHNAPANQSHSQSQSRSFPPSSSSSASLLSSRRTRHGLTSLSVDGLGNYLAASCHDNYIYLFDLHATAISQDASCIARFTGHDNRSFYVKSAISADGNLHHQW